MARLLGFQNSIDPDQYYKNLPKHIPLAEGWHWYRYVEHGEGNIPSMRWIQNRSLKIIRCIGCGREVDNPQGMGGHHRMGYDCPAYGVR